MSRLHFCYSKRNCASIVLTKKSLRHITLNAANICRTRLKHQMKFDSLACIIYADRFKCKTHYQENIASMRLSIESDIGTNAPADPIELRHRFSAQIHRDKWCRLTNCINELLFFFN